MTTDTFNTADNTAGRPRGLDAALNAAVFNSDGLLPAVIQQHDTQEVLMLGWMDREAMRRTLTEGRVTFWSRSRQEYWRKGDTSGHAQYVHSAALDCDNDTLLVQVDQVGVACHTGTRTCFTDRDLDVTTGRRPDAAPLTSHE
ncbi:phosphoribosyl-AMP cyclohydrolase [Leifsonia kafniensis]|uniref:Phosphoribosyl-AMP cyclohydrolase n=1 Tax=Leifsonia kafniensis TaxID=475957 RepID=A0ABP7K7M5_9MICO